MAIADMYIESFEKDLPTRALVGEMHDSTTEVTYLDIGTARIRGSWHLWVLKLVCTWKQSGVWYTMVFVFPPIPNTGTSSRKTWENLSEHPWTRGFSPPVFSGGGRILGERWARWVGALIVLTVSSFEVFLLSFDCRPKTEACTLSYGRF